jgi:hypothetical protein
VLYLARADEPARHRGVVVRLQDTVFAPPAGALRFVRPDVFDVDGWRLAYTRHLRELWRSDWAAFLTLLELATGGGDLTLVDGFGDVDYAPRRILGAALKQIARTQRDEALRRARRGDQSRGRGTARAGGPPGPPGGPRTGAR